MNKTIEYLKNEFNSQGYVLVKNMVKKPSVQEILTSIEQIFEQALTNINADFSGLSLDQKYLLLHKLSPQLKSNCYDILGHLEPLYRHIIQPSLYQLGQALFNSPLLLDGMTVRIGEPDNQRLLPMHQDFGHLSKINLNVWCALTECGEGKGGLSIIPKSHLLGRVPHKYYQTEQGYEYHGVLEKYLEKDLIKTIEMAPGDVLIFHPYLIHGSAENSSNNLRWSAIARLNELNSACSLQEGSETLKWPQHSQSMFGDQ